MRQVRDFEEFVIAETPRLLRLATAMTGNQHDAWDLTQEALARMGERWQRSTWEQPEAYVRTVLARLNIDRLRRARRELLSFATPREQPVSGPDYGAEGWLIEALTTLTPMQRTVLALRFVEDLPLSDIAERLGCREGTVKAHLSRGLARLREHAPAGPTRPARTSHDDVSEATA